MEIIFVFRGICLVYRSIIICVCVQNNKNNSEQWDNVASLDQQGFPTDCCAKPIDTG